MKPLVFQSCQPNPPPWLRRCMETVKAWADSSGYDYRLLGDELFQGIPQSIASKVQGKLPLTDLGRLMWATRLLSEGHDCVIWVDADVVVFDPARFRIDTRAPALVCREISLVTQNGGKGLYKGLNPTVLGFRPGNPFLPRWIEACHGLASGLQKIPNEAFGRPLIEKLARTNPPKSVDTVAQMTLDIISDLIKGKRDYIRLLAREIKEPFAAANLAGHFPLEPAVFEQVIDRLLEDGADALSGKPKRLYAQER